MVFCTSMAYTPTSRLLFSVFCCVATLVFALACFMFLLSSSPVPPATTRIIYTNCRTSKAWEDDRGSRLFHSWSDSELFTRALSAEAKLSSEVGAERRGLQSIAHNGGLLRNSVFAIAHQAKLHGSRGDSSSSAASSPSSHKQPSCLGKQVRPYVNSKIAFLFLTRGPLPFAPLWNQFFHGHEHLYNIYVHLDPFRVGVFDRRTSGVFWGRLIPPDRTERGTPSLVAAERRLLANALLDDPLNQYFALVSERCIPLVGFRRAYDHVMASDKSFLEILRHSRTLNKRYAARGPGELVMLPEVPLESFRVGSQFFVLTRKHAVIVVSDERIWSKFKLPCLIRSECFAEEHYFPTLIDMEDGACATQFTLTNVDWSHSPGQGHPRTYGKDEVGRELITSLRRNNTFLFARKLADDCLGPLLELSSFILGEEGAKMET